VKNTLLTRERDVVEVLVESDLDREVERVATATRRPLRSRCRLESTTAAAVVLLLLDLDEAVAHLDEVDHFRFLELPLHRTQLTAAARADAIRLVELEHAIFGKQARLLCRTEILAALGRLDLASIRVCSDASDGFLVLLRQRLNERQRLLQLGGITFERLELLALGLEHAQQLLDLNLLRERDAPKLLDVPLALQVHASSRSYCALERKGFWLDDAWRQRASTDELAAFDEQRELARGELHALAVVAEQRREASALETLVAQDEMQALRP
jgi:hypothetical protein